MTTMLVHSSGPAGPRPVIAVPDRAPEDHVGVDHRVADVVDEWGRQSFPASDPPANW